MELKKHRPNTEITVMRAGHKPRKVKRVILTDGIKFYAKGIKVDNQITINSVEYAELYLSSVTTFGEAWFARNK